MQALQQAAGCLPLELRRAVLGSGEAVEEIRLRAGRPLAVTAQDGQERVLSRNGQTWRVTQEQLRLTLELATGASYHSAAERLCQGFLPLRGGHRLGVTGTVELRNGVIHGYQSLSSICIRVARPVKGVADTIYNSIVTQKHAVSTLLLSPPSGGKTTLLREVLCTASGRDRLRIGLADERGEVAALWNGVPQLDVGSTTDILDGCPKAEGLLLLLRSMNPQLLAADEITAPQDVQALAMAANCGVPVIATAHGRSVDELGQRPLYHTLLEQRIFEQVIVIHRTGMKREYEVKPLYVEKAGGSNLHCRGKYPSSGAP